MRAAPRRVNQPRTAQPEGQPQPELDQESPAWRERQCSGRPIESQRRDACRAVGLWRRNAARVDDAGVLKGTQGYAGTGAGGRQNGRHLR